MINNSVDPGPNHCRILNPQDIILTAQNQYPTMQPEDTRLSTVTRILEDSKSCEIFTTNSLTLEIIVRIITRI